MMDHQNHHHVVYLPPTRAYGLEYATPPSPFFTVGRIFREAGGVREKQRSYQAVEGGEIHWHDPIFFLDLTYCPAAPWPDVKGVQLSSVEELVIAGRHYSLMLTFADWSNYHPLYRIPQATLKMAGLVAGHRYEVESLALEGKGIKLVGFPQYFYWGIFEPVAG